METSFYTEEELVKLGFDNLGVDVKISRKASFYGYEDIKIGSHVRIGDFCVLSGKIEIKNYVHIASSTLLYGGESGIYICDYCNISSRVAIYAISDDYSGESMTNPLIPSKYKKVVNRKVVLRKNVIIGSGSTILPGCDLSEGTAVGSMSLINHNTTEWSIYAGVPARVLRPRARELMKLEKKFEQERNNVST